MREDFTELNEAVSALQQFVDENTTNEAQINGTQLNEAQPNEVQNRYDEYNSLENHSTENLEHSEIPNVNNITEIESTTRFSSAIWYSKIMEQDVTIAGVGGIGSWVAMLISRMNPGHIYLYDPDTIEMVNLAGQFFSAQQINNPKVNAVDANCKTFSRYYNCLSYKKRFDHLYTNILICGFDNMEARKYAYSKWKERVDSSLFPENMLFIDGRLNAEEFQVFCITGDNKYSQAKYEESWLFDDSDAEEAVCSYKQTSYMANMIASVMTNLFVNFCANLCNPLIERDVPFFTRYDGTTMLFKTE